MRVIRIDGKELPPVKFRFDEKIIINTNEYEVV